MAHVVLSGPWLEKGEMLLGELPAEHREWDLLIPSLLTKALLFDDLGETPHGVDTMSSPGRFLNSRTHTLELEPKPPDL
jgi:hypothetical protein